MSDTHSSHSHHHDHDHANLTGNIKLAFFLNVLFTVIELIGGLLTNSTAILADAIHDLGDSIALGQAWYFQHLTKNAGTQRYTYGFKRFTLLSALINIVILLISAVYVLSEAIPRLMNPQSSHAEGMIFLAIMGIIVNGFAVLRLSKSQNINARVVSLHLLEDVLGWVAILIVALVLMFKDIPILDPLLAILITLYILWGTVKNLKKTVNLLLQAVPDESDVSLLTRDIEKVANIERAHHVHVWSLDGEQHVLTAHLVTTRPLNADEYADIKKTISDIVIRHGFFHSTIELEWPEEACRIGDNQCHLDEHLAQAPLHRASLSHGSADHGHVHPHA